MRNKFTKSNNPNKKKRQYVPIYSREYTEERKTEMMKLLSEATTEDQRIDIIKAYEVTVRPYTK